MTTRTNKQKISNPVSLKATPEIKPTSDLPLKSSQNLQRKALIESVSVSTQYSGPIPPPDAFEKYDKILPGAGNRMLKLVEDEAVHRRSLERDQLQHNYRLACVGQYFAFTLGVIGLGGGICSVLIGHPATAALMACSSLAAIVTPFLKNWRNEIKDKKHAED